ncbi:hypothetical protein FACS1894121_0190 [Bacteroidia bacterium]|nr:hypothetical protein FACS1894121_0190 [Bacteroidia bacterium]
MNKNGIVNLIGKLLLLCAFIGAVVVTVPALRAQNIISDGGVLFVKEKPSGDFSGKNWDNACSLSNALNAVKNNTTITQIWVAAGKYTPEDYPHGSDNDKRDRAFVLVDNVKMYGGFTGTETDINQRPSGGDPSILSGDLDGDGKLSNQDAYHVLVGTKITNTTLLDGFTISGGNADGSGSISIDVSPTATFSVYRNKGGGIYLNESSPTLTNLLIEGNTATNGGGIYSFYSNPKFINSFITNNKADIGSAIYNEARHIQATSITLDKHDWTLDMGKSFTLKATLSPADANSTVVWKSGNTHFATVDAAGTVAAFHVGVVWIYATADEKTDSCKITVPDDGSPYIHIYWGANNKIPRNEETLTWPYEGWESPHSATAHSETPRQITGEIFNAPAGYDNLVWTLTPEKAVIGYNRSTPTISDPGTQANPTIIVHFPTGFVDATLSVRNNSTPQSNASSFDLYAGAFRGNARLSVRNYSSATNQSGNISAHIDIAVADILRPLEVFVTETKMVKGVGFVPSTNAANTLWSVGNSTLVSCTAVNDTISGNMNTPAKPPGQRENAVILTGLKAGSTTYSANSLASGVAHITAGALTVNVSTTWYVGPPSTATGTYGFIPADKVTLTKAMLNIWNFYNSSEYIWPEKNTPAEWHAVIRFTGDESGGINFSSSAPASLDLVNDDPGGQKTISGQVKVGSGKKLTMDRIKVTNFVEVGQGATLTMKTALTEISGNAVQVAGNLIMDNGTISNAATTVQGGGTFTLNNGTISNTTTAVERNGNLIMNNGLISSGSVTLEGNAQGGGRFTMDGGTLNSNTLVVQGYGTFTMNNGTLSSNTLDVQKFGTFTMNNGTLGNNNTQVTVQSGGILTVNAGQVDSKVDVYGDFTMNGGTFNSITNVMSGGTLILKAGTFVSGTAQVFIGGSSVGPSAGTLTTDYTVP